MSVTSISTITYAERYDRQSRIEQQGCRWDSEGIACARVLVEGAGNIGAHVALALAEAGFLDIDIEDKDTISAANLSRSAGFFREEDIGKPKAVVLAERLNAVFPGMCARGIVGDLRWDLGNARYRVYDLVLVGTHDPHSRLHVNKHLYLLPGRTKALIEAGIADLAFSVQTIIVGEWGDFHPTPCYACAVSPDTIGDPDAYQGCNGVVTEIVAPPAATNAMDGAAAAALMAKEAALIMAGLTPLLAGKELRVERDGSADVIRRAWRTGCAEHHRTSQEEILVLPYTPATTVAELHALVAIQCNTRPEDVEIDSLQMITTRAICACGHESPIMRPQAAPVAADPCPGCGRTDPTRLTTHRITALGTDDPDITLGAYGIPAQQALEAYAGGRHYYLVPPVTDEGDADVATDR